MKNELPQDLRTRFADLLDGDDDPATLRLLGRLDRQYRSVNPREWLPGPPRARGSGWNYRRAKGRRFPVTVLAVLVAVLAVSVGVVLATTNILDLGKPTNAVSTNAYFPIGAFHRIGGKVGSQLGGSVELFYDSTSDFSNIEEWPLLKALEQFGTLNGVRAAAPVCLPPPPTAPANLGKLCHAAGFDLQHASLKSRFIHATFRQLVNASGRCLAGALSAGDWKRLVEFSRMTARSRAQLCRGLLNGNRYAGFDIRLPALGVGSYVQSGTQVLQPFDFYPPPPTPVPTPTSGAPLSFSSALPFATIQHDLATGQDPPETTLNADVNAEANIITALTCHADGGRPKSVCGRSVIKAILKHVR